jgi:DNA-binding NtrC family response regulator
VHSVLIVDDDKQMQDALSSQLQAQGYFVCPVDDGAAALELIDQGLPDALVLDVRLSKVDGLEVLRRVRAIDRSIPVIIVSGYGAADEAARFGATAYFAKPFAFRELAGRLSEALSRCAAPARSAARAYAELVGESPSMQQLFEVLRRLESVDAPTVLITGESGTGKDLVARAIHARGPRKSAPYVEVDCVAMPDTLIESELFGHEKGSFTDARQMKRGLFEVARGGVLFLDEIGDMLAGTQAKLLRALENRRFKRVGGVSEIELDAAVIAATNRTLAEEVKAGRFREDLFFRLNVVPIHVPPLRARGDDVTLLSEHLLGKLAATLGRRAPRITRGALEVIRRHSWPGNVRELRNVLERVLILRAHSDAIDVSDLPRELRDPPAARLEAQFALPPEGVGLAAVERILVEQALRRTGGNRTEAAKLLGITRFAFRHRLRKFGLDS